MVGNYESEAIAISR